MEAYSSRRILREAFKQKALSLPAPFSICSCGRNENRCYSDQHGLGLLYYVHNALVGLPTISYSLLSRSILGFVASSREDEKVVLVYHMGV